MRITLNPNPFWCHIPAIIANRVKIPSLSSTLPSYTTLSHSSKMSSAAPSSRQDLVQNAVLFLQDPKTLSSPLTAKIEFLQSKGLNEAEIQEALSRSSSSPGSSSQGSTTGWAGLSVAGGGVSYAMAPVPPKRDWRDLFVSSSDGFTSRHAD